MPRRSTSTTINFYRFNNPIPVFNTHVLAWLSGEAVYNRNTPRAFDALLAIYKSKLSAELMTQSKWDANKKVLNALTEIMFSVDLGPELAGRLSDQVINDTGFRSTRSQGVAKNTGEAFINLMLYGICDALSFQDRIIADKGLPSPVKNAITMKRKITFSTGITKEYEFPIEVDLCIYDREDPSRAILLSAKTRLKEVFHIAVMWKMLFDVIDDAHCKTKWNLTTRNEAGSITPNPSSVTATTAAGGETSNMKYVFATADMIRTTGRATQGPDVERDEPRNLIALDASFMDYVFVSKTGISHVSTSLSLATGRESLFHEMACLMDLIEQHFSLVLP